MKSVSILQTILASVLAVVEGAALPSPNLDYRTAPSGNPILAGWYADPDIALYDGVYWIFSTTSVAFEEQTYFDAFSSSDLITWTKHTMLEAADFSWVRDSLWAATSVRSPADGKYYLYFTANGLLSQELDAGIGVGVADSPGGPYKDALGKRLVDEVINGANPMDPDVFIDDDGEMYFYFGGTTANVALLNDDMVSFRPLPNDGTGNGSTQLFKEITPTSSFVEGTAVFKRQGIYYMMWSENGYGDPTYQVAYGTSDSPLGPFAVQSVVLQQDPTVAVATGHNSVINVPETDIWYIIYHRRPLNETEANNRVVAYNRMYFNEDGTIQPVDISIVEDNFEDGNTIGWTGYGGVWSLQDGQLSDDSSQKTEATSLRSRLGRQIPINITEELDMDLNISTNFTDLVYDADITIKQSGDGSAGLIFRGLAPSSSESGALLIPASGYTVGISLSENECFLELKKAFSGSTRLATEAIPTMGVGEQQRLFHLRVNAVGSNFAVFVDDMDTPRFTVEDDTLAHGVVGVWTTHTSASFDNILVVQP